MRTIQREATNCRNFIKLCLSGFNKKIVSLQHKKIKNLASQYGSIQFQ
jgi:hypothetical protein